MNRTWTRTLCRAASLILVALWGVAMLVGFGHSLNHHDASCGMCITATTQTKMMEVPAPFEMACEPREPLKSAPASIEYVTSLSVAFSKPLRAPPASA